MLCHVTVYSSMQFTGTIGPKTSGKDIYTIVHKCRSVSYPSGCEFEQSIERYSLFLHCGEGGGGKSISR